MLKLNAIWVFNTAGDRVLMCKRHKQPYLGLYNLVGGKIEAGEGGYDAAYRELAEETGITGIELAHLMDFTYYMEADEPVLVEVYWGRLARDVKVRGDEKELVWIDLREDLFDYTRFAGEGNIGHIYEIIKIAEARRGRLPN